MTHRRMSTKRRRDIFLAHEGRCHICGGKIDATREAWDVEHIIALEISRDDSDSNLAPAHRKCHAPKTKEDAGKIAKCKRVEAKHKGYRKRGTLPGSRSSGLKKKITGEVVER